MCPWVLHIEHWTGHSGRQPGRPQRFISSVCYVHSSHMECDLPLIRFQSFPQHCWSMLEGYVEWKINHVFPWTDWGWLFYSTMVTKSLWLLVGFYFVCYGVWFTHLGIACIKPNRSNECYSMVTSTLFLKPSFPSFFSKNQKAMKSRSRLSHTLGWYSELGVSSKKTLQST